jgi:hypothetical protein
MSGGLLVLLFRQFGTKEICRTSVPATRQFTVSEATSMVYSQTKPVASPDQYWREVLPDEQAEGKNSLFKK